MKLVLDQIAVRVASSNKQIIRDVSCEIRGPGVHCLLGPSGAGKTTLLRVINRLADDAPGLSVHGRVTLEGDELRADNCDPEQVRQRICLIQQRPAMFPGTVIENAEFALKHTRRDVTAAERRERALAAIEDVGLAGEVRVDMLACHLSGGQAQRLAIARAIVLDPDVLLMDEPTASLDPISAARIEGLCANLGRSRMVVVVTHDVQMTERVSEGVTVIWPGSDGAHVVESGSTEAVFCDPGCAETRLLLDLADRGHCALGTEPGIGTETTVALSPKSRPMVPAPKPMADILPMFGETEKATGTE